MSGDDEDRLDFGEDEELEDQISLGDAGDTEAAGGFRQQQPQALNDNMDADERLNGTGHAQAAASEEQPLEGSDSEEPLPPGWVTRRSRQGELYYFHEATTESQWDRPTMTSVVVAESIQVTSNDVKSTPAAPAASTSQGMSTYAALQERRRRFSTLLKHAIDSTSHSNLPIPASPCFPVEIRFHLGGHDAGPPDAPKLFTIRQTTHSLSVSRYFEKRI